MRRPLNARLASCRAAGLLFLLTASNLGLAQSADGEHQAFNAARAIADPAQRTSALESYLQDYPAGPHRDTAQSLLLDVLLANFPDRTEEIHTVASGQRSAASAGLERWMEEAQLADRLADAPPNGADLPDAVAWAHDAVASLIELSYRRQIAVTRAHYKLPALTPKQIHSQFTADRARAVTALANVLIRQGHTQESAPLVAEALRLDPLLGETHRLNAELLLAINQPADALNEFIRADAIAPLSPRWREQELELFRDQDHGDQAALDRRIDDAYRSLFPPVFALPHRQLDAGGHPALLELFTGSDCLPCAGPDLAIDSLLGSYSRNDLIALEFDEHIPRPDPLTIPEAAERAAFYTVESTPTAFLDGQPVQLLGSSRQDVENIVISLADQIEDVAPLGSALELRLTAGSSSASHPAVQVSLRSAPTALPEPETTGDASLQTLQHATVYIALAEDNLRYPGKNGVRFHRMVVRALQRAPATDFLTPSAEPRSVTFDLISIRQTLQGYLNDFQSHNDRFGSFQFPTTDPPLDPGHLAVIAWVQDTTTHQVLQSAFLALGAR